MELIALPALLLATAIPLVFLYVIYTLDLYKTGNFRYVILCLAAGGLAFALASFSNRTLYFQGWVSRESIVRFAAPVTEEILKAAVLIYLVRRPNFTYFVDGAIYGFAAGIGFAVLENYQYILSSPEAGLGIAISRVLSTNLIHATGSALVGVAFGLARFKRTAGHIVFIVSGLLVAIGLHSLFNTLVLEETGTLMLVYAAILGFGGAGAIGYIIQRGLKEEKAWIEETLGSADRVTGGEVRVVQRLSDLEEVLKPLRERFGEEKAEHIEQFLTMQARLGILRKTLEKLPEDRMRKAVEDQMSTLRTEMDKERREVGAYCMLYLRHIFPEDASPLWGRLEQQINARIATRPATGGANWMSSLGKRTQPAAVSASGEVQANLPPSGNTPDDVTPAGEPPIAPETNSKQEVA